MKKLLCISLILMLIFLAACAGSTEAPEPEVTNSAETAEPSAPAETEELYEGDEVVSTANIDDINYYAVFTNEDKATVESFAKTVRKQILDKDWAGLADNVLFPITVSGKTYNSKAEFVAADWNSILTAEFLKDIEEETCENMFSNSDGVMLGMGEVWISEHLDDNFESCGLKVIAINA